MKKNIVKPLVTLLIRLALAVAVAAGAVTVGFTGRNKAKTVENIVKGAGLVQEEPDQWDAGSLIINTDEG